jgi:hypothetical protein
VHHGSNSPDAVLGGARGSWMESATTRERGRSGASTVARFESGADLKASTIEAIQDAPEKAGVDFVGADDGGPGARLRPPLRLFAGCVNLVTPAGGTQE